MLENENSLYEDNLPVHHCSAILDALNQMEADEDPDADETDIDNDEKLDELNADIMSNALPKMPTPPTMIAKKQKCGNFAHIPSVCH